VLEDAVVDPLQAPGHLLRRAQQVHTEAWTRLVARVTGPQYAVLVAVAGWPGVDQKTAGELASLDKSTAAAIIGRLATGNWLERVQDGTDRRRRRLRLTAQAVHALPSLTSSARTVQDALLTGIADGEREDFIDALAHVARIRGSGTEAQSSSGDVLMMARTPGYLIRRAQQFHAAAWNERVPDLTGPQYAVISATVTAGVATHTEIGAAASLDSSSTREVVGRLLQRGWLLAVENVHDRRSRPVRVSAPALAVIRSLKGAVGDVQDQLLAPLAPPERERFMSCLRLIVDLAPAREGQRSGSAAPA
jgi:DNA-binding MarR family transcriptional regulator